MEQRDFFISYTKADRAEADWIAETLKDHGYSVYIQTRDIEPGKSFLEKMQEFLEHSRGFIAVWSEHYFDSYYAMLEFRASIAAEKDDLIKVIPVCAEKCKPPILYAHLVHADLFGVGEVEKTRRLLDAVGYRGPVQTDPMPQGSSKTQTADELLQVGINYYWGRNGEEQDYTKAREYYEQAAEKGNASALNYLGYLYHHGLGVAVDYDKAREYYEQAAEKGNASALNNLGYLYHHGLGVAVDYDKAREYYEQAAENGHAMALNNLGALYHNGQGVDVDYDKAESYYQQAIDKGETEYAPDNLKRLWEKMENT